MDMKMQDRIHNNIERSILEDYNIGQGRSEKQYEDSAKILAYSLLGFASLIIVLMIIM